MLKLIFYGALTLVGVIGALVSPLAGAIAVIEAYLLNPSIYGLPVEIRFQLVTTVAFAVGVLIHSRQGLPRAGYEGMLIVSLWAFLIVASLVNFMAQYSVAIAFRTFFEVVKTVIVATLLLRAIRSERDLRFFMTACIIGVFHAAALHVIGPKLGYIPMSRAREYAVLPDDQTAVMVAFIPLLLVVAATGVSKFERILAFCALPIALDSIVNSYQRTGFVALGVEVAILFLLSGGRILKRLLPAAIVAGVLFFARMTPDNYWEWVSTVQSPTEEASAASRFEIGKGSINMFLDHPLGVGYRNYPYISHRYLRPELINSAGMRSAHNSFFAILCETGILGFLPWLGAFLGAAFVLRKVRKASRKAITPLTNYALALEVAIYGWLVSGLAQAIHDLDPVYWFVALAIIIVRLHRMADSQTAAATPGTVSGVLPVPLRRIAPAPAVSGAPHSRSDAAGMAHLTKRRYHWSKTRRE